MSPHRSMVMTNPGSESPLPAGNPASVATSIPEATTDRALFLRAGEWVEVLSLAEILPTLDANASLDGLPFMPEMAQYCGRKFRVFKSAHKTCDTIEHYAIRRMENAVHLEGLRCDGAAHGGCQAGCLIFWKEAWLKRTERRPGAHASSQSLPLATSAPMAEAAPLQRGTRAADNQGHADERYRCQATELLNATTEVRRRDRWDPRFYLKDLTSGNVRVHDFVWYGTVAIFNAFINRLFGRRYPHVCGLAGARTPTAEKHLKAGELVRIRSKQEIVQTLNPGLRNRGLWFDVEMVPYCESGPFPVLRRVERIIDEKTGRLLQLPTACVILDGVTCSGHLSMNRMFCPRSLYPYWREIWLDRVEHSDAPDSFGNAQGSDEKP